MKVMITGGTGFVGSHTVSELIRAGHEVKLPVRDPNRISSALNPLGVGEVESVTGDVTDKESVEKSLGRLRCSHALRLGLLLGP